MSRTTHTNRNLAARMGRWSAAHWKTATFGWLAFVLVAFALGGAVGMNTIDPNAARAGRVRPHGQDSRRRLQAARRRERPGPEQLAARERPRLQGCGRRRRRRHLQGEGRSERSLAVRVRQRRADRPERARGPRRVRDPRRPGRCRRQGRLGARRRRRPAEGPPGALHRRVRRREQGRRGGDRLRERPRQGRSALASGHAAHPRGRVRSARGGGHPAAPRSDRRLRHVRPDRDSQSRVSGRDAGTGAGAPGRARGRRRLLDVLLEARTRRAGRGPQRAGGARGRRRDVGPLGAHLRPDRDRGDGRHVPDRRPDLRLAGCGGHHGRRDRRSGLADRPAGAAVEARRQGRSRTGAARRARSRRGGEGRIWGAIIDRVLRRPLLSDRPRRRAAAGAGSAGSPAAPGHAGAGHVPEVAARHAGVRADAAGVPGHRAAGERRRRGPERRGARGEGGDRSATTAGARERPDVRADHRRRQP